jgi:hypothetical protein
LLSLPLCSLLGNLLVPTQAFGGVVRLPRCQQEIASVMSGTVRCDHGLDYGLVGRGSKIRRLLVVRVDAEGFVDGHGALSTKRGDERRKGLKYWKQGVMRKKRLQANEFIK